MADVTQVSTPMVTPDPLVQESESNESTTQEAQATPSVDNATSAPTTDEANVATDTTTESDEAAPNLEIQEQAANLLTQAGLDMAQLQTEFDSNGELSEESFAKLDEAGFPRQLVDNYIAGVSALNVQNETFIQNVAYDSVGGQDQYQVMTKWAEANMSADEITAYNAAITSMDRGQATLAVAGLSAKYHSAVGREGTTVQGSSGATQAGDVYETKTTMLADLASTEYRTSPSFRAQVETKVARSMERHGGSIPT